MASGQKYILRALEGSTSPTKFNIITELVNIGNLLQVLPYYSNFMPENIAVFFFRLIIKGLSALEENKISGHPELYDIYVHVDKADKLENDFLA